MQQGDGAQPDAAFIAPYLSKFPSIQWCSMGYDVSRIAVQADPLAQNEASVEDGLYRQGPSRVPVCMPALRPLHLPALLQLLDAPCTSGPPGPDICPRTCPSARATLCTYYRWFARPQHLRRPGSLLMQPLSARCMRVLLRFWKGAHSLPVVQGRRTGAPRAQRACVCCVTNMQLGTNATWSLSALLCKVRKTSMLHCMWMALAPCSSSCGSRMSLV